MSKSSKRTSRRYRPLSLTHGVPRRLPRSRVEIDRGLAWHVVWTACRSEQRAEHELRAYGLETYRPLEAFEIVKRGRAVEVERDALGRYLFVGLNAAAPQFQAVRDALEDRTAPSGDFAYLWQGREFWVPARNVMAARPLGRLLSIDDIPVRVPAAALQGLADGLTGFGGYPVPGKWLPTAGGACRAIYGPFQGFLGVVEAADDYRVRALVDLFGRRTSVEFDLDQLEAA